MAIDKISRRELLAGGAALVAGVSLTSNANAKNFNQSNNSKLDYHKYSEASWDRPGEPGKDYTPVITPNGATLPYKVIDGIKVFHLIAEEVNGHEFAKGIKGDCWGFNGRVHGPTIEAVEGDRVRIYVTNRLPESTAIHWHGLLLPNGMDGVGGLNQKVIKPNETYKYEFTLRQHGTHMYHSHHDEMTQMAMGMLGLFIIHPRNPTGPRPDRDFAFMLGEWRVDPGTSKPNPFEMTDFNLLTLNAKVFPATDPIVAKYGDRVRIRIGNLSAMDHHPIHLHGYQFKIVETDGGRIPDEAQWPEVTVLVPTGSTRTIEFIADEPGDWAMHCHMTHHVMNQMGHKIPNTMGIDAKKIDSSVQSILPDYMTMGDKGTEDMGEMQMGIPENSIPMVGGKGPHGYITMGGMFTILKVRKDITNYNDPGWYEGPKKELASKATRDDLDRDGIKL